ncbi:calcium-binding protein [uncultured Pelagimonas sp.]|uniref:calcium-binding protein n=1 Tax=uncultured Pelagimonas sp. TaxID=1618102 RepID=UPI00262A52FF|nr:calcium-binding protein [uncultured Pelagimonas sp.]
MIKRLAVWVSIAILAGGAAFAQARDASSVYFFGNSLVHHLSEEDDHTNVPHWLNEMAKVAGKDFAVEGQWGFLRNFAEGLPPVPNWSFPGVKGAGRNGFGNTGFDAVVVTPANFVQYQKPDAPYDGENPNDESPLGAMIKVFDWVAQQSPETRLFVYEGWAEMGGITGGFPPSGRGLRRYHKFNQGDYHAWYEGLIDTLDLTRPDHQIQLIPVASVLSDLLADGGVLEGLPAEALYSDDAPHGTPTLYLLAAMVTYSSLYNEKPPVDFRPPTTLHPDIVDKFAQVSERIWQAMPESQALERALEQAPQAVAEQAEAVEAAMPERLSVVLPPSGARPDGVPVLGMGLNGISDWSTQHPFLDLMKSARGWVGHKGSQWGAVSTEELRAGGFLDENGWPVGVPEGVTALEAVLLTSQPEGSKSISGKYVLTYEGQGKLQLTGRAKRAKYDDGQVTFSYSPGEGLVGLKLTEVDAQNPIRNIRILKQDHVEMYAAGALFNPAWVERIQDMRSIRFMDWMMTNGSPVTGWDDRPRMSDASWTQWGVPLEVMLRLANHVGADPWFTLPHMADDDYVRQFAETVKAGLDPRLKVHVEYSNEVWNHIFPQAVWARNQATDLWGESDTGWMQFYGLRAAQVMNIWSDVYGDAGKDRLVRVVGTHTGWPGLEEDILRAPLAFLQLGAFPQDSFDAYAVTGYFGYELGTDEMAQVMNNWLDQSEAIATKAGEAQGLRRVALREFVKKARFEAAIAPVTLALQDGSLRELTEEIFPYQAAVARKAGLRLVMYEGGTHVTAHGAQVNDDRLTAFLTEFNYTPEMAKLYELLLAGWVQAGGTMFNAFVDVAPATKWGSWGALRHLDDSNPRWDMLMAFNAAGPGEWEKRDLAAFNNGITRIAGTGNQRLQGTTHEDVLIAGSGNDTLVSSGGNDILHGGSGTDKAILPGTPEDYRFEQNGSLFVARNETAVIRMSGIEELLFEGAAGRSLTVAGL